MFAMAFIVKYICIILFSQFLSIQSSVDTFDHAIDILEKQNNRKFDSLIIVSDLMQDDDQIDPFRGKLFDLVFDASHYYLAYITRLQNVTHVINEIDRLSRYFDTVIIVISNFQTSNSMKQILYNISKEQFQENTWLIINPYTYTNSSDESMFAKSFQDLRSNQITFDTQLYILSGTMYSASLVEIFKTCDDNDLIYNTVQTLQHENPPNQKSILLWERRNNLMGCNLRVAYIDQHPYITKNKDSSKIRYTAQFGNETFYGGQINQIQLMELLSDELNFTTVWIPTKDNSYGVYNGVTKRWNGLIGMLANDQADLSNAFFTVTSLRSKAITFTADIGILKFGLYMAKPSVSPSWTTFIDVFDFKYWGILLGGIIIVSLTLALFSQVLDNKNHLATSFHQFSSNVLSSLSVVLLSMGACDVFTSKIKTLCQSNASKLLILIICFLGLLNKEAYTGGLISTLVSKQFQSDINLLEDFLRQPGYQLLLRSGTASVQYFSEAKQYPHKEIWKNLLENRSIAYIHEPRDAEKRLMANSKEVYFDVVSQIEPTFEHYPCNIIRAAQTYFHRSFALGLKKNSPYVKLLNQKLAKYKDYGVLANMGAFTKVRKEDINCPSNHLESVGYETIFSAFVILGVGLICSLIYALVENFNS